MSLSWIDDDPDYKENETLGSEDESEEELNDFT